ncbi:MAG: hypothetical protein RSD04_00055 [Clostridia bacterium]
MSMPVIIPSTTTREQAITDLIESVALEETGLSHIINAEGEKIQAVVKVANVTPAQLLEVNKSVQDMIKAITSLEMVLENKLDLFSPSLNA